MTCCALSLFLKIYVLFFFPECETTVNTNAVLFSSFLRTGTLPGAPTVVTSVLVAPLTFYSVVLLLSFFRADLFLCREGPPCGLLEHSSYETVALPLRTLVLAKEVTVSALSLVRSSQPRVHMGLLSFRDCRLSCFSVSLSLPVNSSLTFLFLI